MARGPGTAPLKKSQGEELGGLTQERWEIGLSMLKKKWAGSGETCPHTFKKMLWKRRETPFLPPQPLESLSPENSRFTWICRLITPASKVPVPPSSPPKGVGRCHKAWHLSAQSVLGQLGRASLCLLRLFPIKGLLVPDTTTLGSLFLWGGGKGGGGGGNWATEGKMKFKITRGVFWVPAPPQSFLIVTAVSEGRAFLGCLLSTRKLRFRASHAGSKSQVCRGQFKHFLHLQDPEPDLQHEAGCSPNPGDTQIRSRSGWVCPSLQPRGSPLGSWGAVAPSKMARALMREGLLPWGRSQHRGGWEAPGEVLSLSRLLCPNRRGFQGPLGCQTASKPPTGQCRPHSANPRTLPPLGHS